MHGQTLTELYNSVLKQHMNISTLYRLPIRKQRSTRRLFSPANWTYS